MVGRVRRTSGRKSDPRACCRIVSVVKRTPIRRRTPLARSSMRRRTERSAYRARERDVGYMLWVKRQPCLMRGVWGCCSGPVEADHAGLRGIGRKAHDSTCIPLCRYHHGASRFPRNWSQVQRRAWLHAAVVYTQASARAVGVSVPIDPAPVIGYPAMAVDLAGLELQAALNG
jgi:hypothetical protein